MIVDISPDSPGGRRRVRRLASRQTRVGGRVVELTYLKWAHGGAVYVLGRPPSPTADRIGDRVLLV
jgi:hypothetical protein